jgi:hypothetical protein
MSIYRPDDLNKTWQCPSFTMSPGERLEFCKSMKQMGETWVQSQPAFGDIPKAIDILSGRPNESTSETRSGINTARLKRDAREIVGTLANIRPFWGFSSDANVYGDSATMMNKVARAVYLESFFDRALKGALQYAMATGDGYIWLKYSRSMYGRGEGKIKFDYLGALDVLPVQMPRDNDLQEAYLVTIVDMPPVARAHAMFPMFQDKLKPQAKKKYRGSVAAQQRMTLAERFKMGANRKDSFMELYSEVNYQYILDNAINTTGVELPMGQEGTSWFYKVPYIGQEIIKRDPLTGQSYTRKARPDDCYIYPYRRLMIFCDDALMYDGPAWDWHAKVPLVRFSMDRWPWEGIGQVLLRDGYEYQHAINQLERAAQTVANARLRPGLTYNISAGGDINTKTAEGLDPFAPDVRVGVDSEAGGDRPAFGTILPENLMEVPVWFFTLMEHYNMGMDYQLGLKDITALAKLRATGDSDSFEKMMEVMGPIVQDISRDMEKPIQEAGDMMKYLVLQYMTTRRVMQYVGEDGVPIPLFDYDPESLIPSHMPFEAKNAQDGKESEVDKITRMRHFAQNLRFLVTPYSVHELNQFYRKLALIQAKKEGVWISSQTIAEAFNVPNYGHINGATEIERYWNEKFIELKHMVELQKATQGLSQVPGMDGGSALSSVPGADGQASGAGTGSPVGRPSSYSASPTLQQKDGGTRSTIATSK